MSGALLSSLKSSRYWVLLWATAACLGTASSTIAQTDRSALAERVETVHATPDPSAAYETLRREAEADNDLIAVAALHHAEGVWLANAGRYQEALRTYETGLEVLGRLGNLPMSNRALALLYELSLTAKSYAPGRALPFCYDIADGRMEHPAMLLTLPDTVLHRRTFVNLALGAGTMYLHQQQSAAATQLFQQVLATGLANAQALLNLAWTALQQHIPQQALHLLDTLRTEKPEPYAPALMAEALAHYQQGAVPTALRLLDDALVLYNGDQNGSGRACALVNKGLLHLSQQDNAAARSDFEMALQQDSRTVHAHTRSLALVGLALSLHHLDQPEAALNYFGDYLSVVEHLAENFETDQGRLSLLENQTPLFERYLQRAFLDAVTSQNLATLRPFIERLRERSLVQLQSDRHYERTCPPGTLEAGYALFGKERWTYLRNEYAQSIGFEPDITVQYAPGVQNSLTDGCASDASFSPEAAPGSGLSNTVVDDVLPTDARTATLFLEYYLFPDRLAIIVTRADEVVTGAAVEVPADSLEYLVTTLGHLMETGTIRGLSMRSTRGVAPVKVSTSGLSVEALSRHLYDLLVAPVASQLPRGAPLVVVPHRALHGLPFSALLAADDSYFGDAHPLTFAASTASWRVLARRPRKHDHQQVHAWIVGDPAMPSGPVQWCGFDLSFGALPGARREAEQLHALLGAANSDLFIGTAADRLRLEAWHPAYSVLHFATHGFACPDDPLSSLLVLSEVLPEQTQVDEKHQYLRYPDGLRPVVLYGLDSLLKVPPFAARIQERSFPGLLDAFTVIDRFHLNADLVVLSACQTGLGRFLGQGAIGLTRAFLVAGARSILVSLWRVDDAITTEFMLIFYQEYLQHGNKAQALQRASQAIRIAHPEPKYWASFTLVGMAE